MSLPKPPVALNGACSVIVDNVIYSYSGSAFQSLALAEGAEWEKLPEGESVEGGVCVGTTSALFVVGGTSASPDYTGLQKYTYATKEWQTVQITVMDMKNRVNHSAAYIPASDSILVYAGDQDGSAGLSSQTFTIGASEPHGILSFQSTISPPGVAPLVLPWSTTQAAMISGNPTNLNVVLFDPATSWVDSGATLAAPLWKNGATPKAALIVGDDGSKHLYTFDLSAAPNQVERIVLVDGNGAPVVASAPIASVVKKRQLNAANWPDYNSTLAPTVTRNGYSVASDSNGMIVFTGGNDDEALCIFNGKENQWVNARQLLVPQQVLSAESTSASLSPSATATEATSASSTEVSSISPSPDASATSSATLFPSSATTAAETASASSSSAAVASGPPQGLPPTTILGMVLGIIFGIALILVLLLFFLKKARQRQNAARNRGAPAHGAGGMSDEKGPLPSDLPIGPSPWVRGHAQQGSQGSFSSMAILVGKSAKPAVQRKMSNESRRSSVSSIFNKEFKSTIGRPQYKETPEPDFIPRNEKGGPSNLNMPPVPRPAPAVNQDGTIRRSSGWNRYWSGASLNILGLGSGNNTQRQTMASETSRYSDTNNTNNNRITQDSATVPPLHVDTKLEFNRVNSGSPTVSQYNPRIREGVSGQIERPASDAPSGYSSGIPESVHEKWNPNSANSAKQPWGSDRAPSSAYSNGTGNAAAVGATGGSRPPTGVSRLPQLETAALSTDMSWLNLGETNPSKR